MTHFHAAKPTTQLKPPYPGPTPENTHHCELKRDVMRERSLDWIVMEKGRVED